MSNIKIVKCEVSGINNSAISIVGEYNSDFKVKLLGNGKEIKHNLTCDNIKNKFVIFAELNGIKKVTLLDENNEVLLKVTNRKIRRIGHKIKNILKRIFLKIYYFLCAIFKTIKYAWQNYHFLILPKEWANFCEECKMILRSVNIALYYNMDNIIEYNKWLKKFEKEEEQVSLNYKPLISILIPVYNIEQKYLFACVDSILNQTYENFEICIVDDASTKEETINSLKLLEEKDSRIKIKYRKKNGHISATTNDALAMAKGEFVGLVDDDDLLAPNALYEVVKVLNENKKLDFIYSDEDKIDEKGVKRCYPHFKPDFSPDTLMGGNYICHFSVIRTSIVKKVGGFEVGLEGAQDHDLFLKISEVTDKFYHIPKILYHWRMIPGSTAAVPGNKSYAYDRGRTAVENALKRRKLNGTVTQNNGGHYFVDYQLKNEPLISIIIPTKDYSDTLEKCLVSIYEKTTYKNYEVIVVNNNSVEEKTFKLFDTYKNKYSNFKVIDANMEFNYSKINNLAVKEAKGEYIVLLNNDTEVITPEWLEKMVGYASLEHIGAVGVKLLYFDDTVQHGGVVLGICGIARHAYVNQSRDNPGNYGRLLVPYNYSAVTAACLMVKKSKFESVGGLEEELAVNFNDVDFNLKLLKKGYYNILLPHVLLYHYESKSRGFDTTLKKQTRSLKECEYMYKHWGQELLNDKMYNPNFSKSYPFVLEKKDINNEKTV